MALHIRPFTSPRLRPSQSSGSRCLLPSRWAPSSAAVFCGRQDHRRCVQARVGQGGGFPGGMNPGDPYMELFKSPIFQNSVVVKEFTEMVDSLMSLSRMASKFPDFDTAGKRMYLEQMRESSGRYELFIKRLELSEDPAAREFLRVTNAQMLNGGFTLPAMFSGLKQSLQQYEQWITAEEAAIAAGPAAHQEFLKTFRQVWQQTALGAIDTAALSDSIPPEVLMKAQQDPQFWAAIKEISDNPTPEVMAKWMESPTLGPLITELARSMLQKRMNTSM